MGLARNPTKEQRYDQDTFSTMYPISSGRLVTLSGQLLPSNGAIAQAVGTSIVCGGQGGDRHLTLTQNVRWVADKCRSLKRGFVLMAESGRRCLVL